MNSQTTQEYLGRSIDEWKKQLAQSDEPIERRLAAYALEQIGSAETVDALTKALKDQEDYVRVWAAAALGQVEDGNDDALQALIEGMKADRSFVRSLAVWHLSRLNLSPAALEQALPKVKELFEDPDPSVRVEADLAWKRIHARSHMTH